MMDAVITYVNGQDPLWLDEYMRSAGGDMLEKRFRDWGTLPFLLRGIQTFMPFIRNVFLVVASESQVPLWVDRSQLEVVLHSDIIPQEYLPLFNSASIEMFLHRIEGLDENFIYFNDDFFPVSPCSPEDFFHNGKAVFGLARHLFASNLYKKQTRNSDRLARRAAGVPSGLLYIRPQHICSPMLKSASEELFARRSEDILNSVTTLRAARNYNQYLFTDYLFFTGRAVVKKLPSRHFSLAVSSVRELSDFLRKPSAKVICINDVQMSEKKYLACRTAILEAFGVLFPRKSRFEI